MNFRCPAFRTAGSRSRARRLLGGCVALLLGGTSCLSSCSRQEAGGGKSRSADRAAVPVKVATAVQSDVPVQIRSIARVEAYATVTVKPQVVGQITDVLFTEGQDVKVNDLLFNIDPRPFEAALRQAEATLAKDTALAEDAEKEVVWEANLLKQNAAAQREYEKSRADADALQATVRADVAAVERARLDLEYCAIRSPIDGRTGDVLIDRGNVVKADEAMLVVINQISPIYVVLSLPEQHLSAIVEHQAAGPLAVEATIPQDDGPTEHGVLTFVDNKVDNTTGTITLKATFNNEDRRLWPGQFVNAVVTLTIRPGAIVVPSSAVQTGQTGQFVYVVKDDRTAELRPIVAGFTLDDRIVIEQGLGAGEVVVTDGQLRLVPGAAVDLRSAASQPSTAAAVKGQPDTQP